TGARGALLTSTVLTGGVRDDDWAVFEYTRVGPLTLGPGETCGIQIKGNVEIRCQGVFSPGAKVCGIFEPGLPPPRLRLRTQSLNGSVEIDLSCRPDFTANGGSVYLMAGS